MIVLQYLKTAAVLAVSFFLVTFGQANAAESSKKAILGDGTAASLKVNTENATEAEEARPPRKRRRRYRRRFRRRGPLFYYYGSFPYYPYRDPRICCLLDSGGLRFLTPFRCYQRFGRIVPRRECRFGYAYDSRVCCSLRDGRRLYMNRFRCRERVGRVVARRYCLSGGRYADRRYEGERSRTRERRRRTNNYVCCSRPNRRDRYYETRRDCQRAGGRVVSSIRCRRPRD